MRDWGISVGVLMGGDIVEPIRKVEPGNQEADRTNQQLLLASNAH